MICTLQNISKFNIMFLLIILKILYLLKRDEFDDIDKHYLVIVKENCTVSLKDYLIARINEYFYNL
jgi:hypothetical protein